MKNMTTKSINISLPNVLCLLFLFVGSFCFGQTVVTDVFPNRVTYKTKVTIVGTGFTETTRDAISISGGISIINKTLVSSTEMTFEIGDSGATSNSDRINRTLNITGASFPNGDAKISYIGYLEWATDEPAFTNITEVFTNWDYNNQGYWRSGNYSYSNRETYPNDSHELLAFTYNGVTYSTGVDDALLSSKNISFNNEIFKAYSTNGVEGNTHNGNLIELGDLVDGESDETDDIIRSNDVKGLTVFDVITDGVNGLDLGTGITNFNSNASIRFFSGNGQVGAVSDNVPDLVITQIAQAGGTDTYYYADEIGNIVGRPIRLTIVENKRIARLRIDFYDFIKNTNYDIATPQTRVYSGNQVRSMQLIALKLEDFEISASNIDNVNNINLLAGGTSDMAFLAFNTSAFEIKSPKVDKYPLSRYICRPESTTENITFSPEASINGTATSDPLEDISYQWYRYNTEIPGETNSSLTILDVDVEDIANYKLKVTNGYGTVTLPVSLSEGGTPFYWDNNSNSWSLPQAYIDEGITVSTEDRSLVFSSDYSNKTETLVGCDCLVPAGNNVTIGGTQSMTLYNNIVVEEEIEGYVDDEDFVVEPVPAATFTLENNASLVQINEAASPNEGIIKMKREATDIKKHDYVYWSAPVADFNVSGIARGSSHIYKWDAKKVNPNSTTGYWDAATNQVMGIGEGYSIEVSNAGNFTVEFEGVPNSGTITTAVKRSVENLPEEEDRHWNLVGNPYPSAIDAETFLLDNTNISGGVSIWTHGTAVSTGEDDPFYGNYGYNYNEDDYVVYNGTGSNPGGKFQGKIAAGQGFFIQLTDGVGDETITFNNAMRFDASENPYANNQFHKAPSQDALEKQLLWLNLVTDDAIATTTLVGYVEGATVGKDRLYDAYSNSKGLSIYSILEDNKLVIQGRPLPFTDEDQVPLGVDVINAGSYKIGIDAVEGKLFATDNQAIFLEDTYLNMEHDLRLSPYAFSSEQGEFKDRFILKYQQSTSLSIQDELVKKTFAYISNGEMVVKSNTGIQAVKVFDISGKQLQDYKMSNNSNRFTTGFPFARGVYIVNIALNNGVQITKKLIH